MGDQHAEGASGPGEVRELAGVRRVEAQLLALVQRALDAPPDGPARFAHPVRVVVPSSSLRVHVAARIAQSRGRAAVGLSLQSLPVLALEILARSGVQSCDPLLFPLWVRREARREPALAEGLDDRVDGYGAVVGAVDDLLDAGFEPAHADVLEEHLDAQQVGRDRAARARAIVRVAARVASRLEREGVGHRSQLLARAREQLELAPEQLPHRGLLLHGFADATGVQADLIASLLRVAGATLLLDAPRDVSSGGARRAGPRFGAAFRERFPERLASGASASNEASPLSQTGRIRLLQAPGPTAEVRAVALRLREQIDAGVAPERLAVVARDLSSHRILLRTQLSRLGVPFSGAGERGAATAARRRLDALLALIAPDDAPSMETWLAARDGLDAASRAALRQTCHRRGALRLEDVARLTGSNGDAASARSLCNALGARPGSAALARHGAWLEQLARDSLRWRAETPGCDELLAALAALPAGVRVDAHEFVALLVRLLDGAGLVPLGGEGGGVQVLSVMEARARSFDQLFVLGLQRGAFPRTIQEDALLPDAIRARLREVLPDLPVKREGFDEERFLFAQLLSAAEQVTLCWSDTNAEGRPQPRSPLLESLLRAGVASAHEQAPPLHTATPGAGVLAESERALLEGLHAPRSGFGPALERALAEAGASGSDGASPALRAAARLAVLDELDPRDGRRGALGPYFGFVGEAALPGDPREESLFVTRLESLARCPWQMFLTRVLRLEPVPDAAGDLPAASDARLLGNVVHRALERVTHRPLEEGDDLATREAQPVPWPDAATLERWVAECAERELRENAIAVPGYARVLARRALPFLSRARACDWREGSPAVVGTEAVGAARVRDAAGREREIRYRADRVDRVDGRLVLTDYKTGKPIAGQKTRESRDETLRKQIAKGRSLQAFVYALGGGSGARGRYLFLAEDVLEDARALVVADAPPWDEAFAASLPVLLDAWDRGSFLPRLRQADRDEEPGACRSCEVRDACIRGDSGARARLERWAEADGARRDAERAALAVYRLGVDA